MKAYRIFEPSMSGLQQVVEADPAPAPDEVLVRIHAVSLNYKDLFFIRPLEEHGLALPKPTIPISDGAGEVVAVGANVRDFKVGDHVVATASQKWDDGVIAPDAGKYALGYGLDGVLCEYRALKANGLLPVPGDYTDDEASTLPIAAVTAWNAVRNVKPGQTVLVLGTGGVSIFALQFAHAVGARVILTSSSDEKLARGRDLGASDTINYRTTPEWSGSVMDLTQGLGVDHVIESIGGRTLEQSIEAARYGGTLHMLGRMNFEKVDTAGITEKSLTAQGIRFGSRAIFEDMNRFIEKTGVRPVIDSVFSFDDTLNAYRHLESGAHFGKIVIAVD